MKKDLLQTLSQRVLVADGAMGTRLQAIVGHGGACIDSFNLDPAYADIVASIHRSYLMAGAELILTNTYGANVVKLTRYGRQVQAPAINREGVRIAKRCLQPYPDRWVAGSVGPLEIYSIRDEYSEEQIEGIFREQMQVLVEEGVDLLALETFQDLEEAACALRVAKEFSLPVLFSVGGVHGGRTGTGADAREFAALASRLGADIMGCNCRGPYDILETVQLLSQVTSLPLAAMPNAGSPEIDRGRVAYHVDPGQFRSYAVRLVKAGAALLGGCCGTEPEHIAQMAQAVKELPPPPPRLCSEVRVFEKPPSALREQPATPPPNPVEQVFTSVPFVVSVEMRPGRATPLQDFIDAGRELARAGVHLFDVPDNAGARVTVDPMYCAALLQSETRIPTIMHLSTSHRNLVATQSYLLGCWQAGIQSILAVTGDHPNVGDHDKYTSRVNDLKSSVNLMSLCMKHLNQGRLFNETACIPTNFFMGGGMNPVRGLTAQIKWLQKKIEAGARYVFTQPVYHEEDVDRLLEATAGLDIPILVGIMPLTSRRNAEFFAAGKIPGIIIPQEILEKFEKVTTPEDGRRLGMDLALDLLRRIRGRVRGLYLLPPFGKDSYAMVKDMLSAVELTTPGSERR